MEHHKKHIVWTVVAVVGALGALLFTTFFFRGGEVEVVEVKGDIVSFVVEQPYFVIKGHNIATVDIYGVLDNTNDRELISRAHQIESNDDSLETWTAKIPEDRTLYTQMYLDTTDVSGNTVDRFYLTLNGYSEIFSALWLETPGDVLVLSLDDEMLAGGLVIKLLEITRDNRCPADVECVTAGGVEILLGVTIGETTEEVLVATDSSPVTVAGRIISIHEVQSPEPLEDVEISDNEYRFVILLEQAAKG